MKQIFTCGYLSDDMLGWASRLKVIGSVFETIGDKEDVDGWVAEGLGMIISDYAQALESTLTAFFPEISKVVDDVEFPSLVGIERDYKKIKNHHECPHKTDLIKENLEKIKEFKEKISFILDIEKDLEKWVEGKA